MCVCVCVCVWFGGFGGFSAAYFARSNSSVCVCVCGLVGLPHTHTHTSLGATSAGGSDLPQILGGGEVKKIRRKKKRTGSETPGLPACSLVLVFFFSSSYLMTY